MRATQFVRRGLIAFATVATLSAGLAGAASAQVTTLPGGSAGVTADNDAIVLGTVPGFDVQLLSIPGFGETAILALGTVPSAPPAVVIFRPDVSGAAVINPGGTDVVAPRP